MTDAAFWTWDILRQRGWTTRLYERLIRNPRFRSRLPWSVNKQKVLKAEAMPEFKEAVARAIREHKAKHDHVQREMDRCAVGWEYVVVVRRMPEHPIHTLDALVGPENWRSLVRHIWTERNDVLCFLIRDARGLAALRLSEVNEYLVSFRTVEEWRAFRLDALARRYKALMRE